MNADFDQRWSRFWGRVGAAFAPPRGVGGLEGLLLRLLFAFVIPQTLPGSLDKATQPKPNGLAWWLDFTWLATPGVEGMLHALLACLLILYVAGAGLSLVAPLLLALTVAIRTLDNSDGSVHHGYQVVSMVLLAQSAVHVWHAWLGRSLGGRRRGTSSRGERHGEEAWVLWASQLAMVALYLVSVVSKLQNSGGEWLLNSHGFATEVVKTARQNYFSRLDPVWGPDTFPAWAAWIAAHPNLARLMFGAGFACELMAVLVLLRWRWVGAVVGLGLIGMHTSIDLVMGLAFPQNVECLWIFFVGVPFLLAWPWRKLGQWLEDSRPTDRREHSCAPARADPAGTKADSRDPQGRPAKRGKRQRRRRSEHSVEEIRQRSERERGKGQGISLPHRRGEAEGE